MPFLSIFDGNIAAATIVAVLSFLFFLSRKHGGNKLPYPPGPRRLPVIGSMLEMPHSRLWETVEGWGKVYGDLVYVENVGLPMLFINSYETAVELLSKRSAIYSSRPRSVMAELEGWGWTTAVTPHGEVMRKHRAFMHKFFQSPDTLNFLELQQNETYVMLNGILGEPKNYERHVRRLPGAVMLMNVYGHEVKDENDEFVKLGEASIRAGSESLQYFYLDFLPWLRYLPEWFPGASFHSVAKEVRELSHTFRNKPYFDAKKKYEEGTAKECMMSVVLSENTREDGTFEDEEVFRSAAATSFLGGTDTSVVGIMTSILAMLLHPDKLQKAHDELDRVVGKDRLPTFEDRKDLPYIRAICTEAFRWQVIAPLLLPHSTTADDEYRGYFIPAKTAVFANAWAISRNPKIYPDPDVFTPERWLSANPPTLRPEDFTFGFGHRTCPGQNWAEHVVFIAVASILAAFKIEKAIGPDGVPVPPNDKYHPSMVRSLGPSECTFIPRSEKMASLIRQAVDAL